MRKDEADQDVVCVGEREVFRSKAVRKIAEHWDSALLISMQVGPWDLKRGVQTALQQAKPAGHPLPNLRVSFHGVEGETEPDEQAVRKYARDEDKDDEKPRALQSGGELLQQVPQPPQELQAVGERIPEMSDAEMQQMIDDAVKGDREGDVTLPVPSRQKLSDPEAVKPSLGEQSAAQAKFVKFDQTAGDEKKPKLSRTGMYSPSLAGDTVSSPAGSPSSSTGHVRLVTGGIELSEEDEPEIEVPLESWDWDVNDQLLDGDYGQYEIPNDEKLKRGFFCEDAGPPHVNAEELAFLDKQAMYAELERPRKLEVICDVREGVDVTQAFRGQSASTEETVSPTTPLMMVKVLMVNQFGQRTIHVSFSPGHAT